MKIPGVLPGIALALMLQLSAHAQVIEQKNLATLSSPDQQIRVVLYERLSAKGERQLNYRVEYQHKLVVFDSRLDFQAAPGVPLHIAEGRPARPTAQGDGQLLDVGLAGAGQRRASASLQLLADNGGVAFRLHAPRQAISKDVAEFVMPVGARIVDKGAAEGGQPMELANWRGPSALPLDLSLLGAISVQLNQSPKAHFTASYAPAPYQADTIVSTIAAADGAGATNPAPGQERPWRRISIALKR